MAGRVEDKEGIKDLKADFKKSYAEGKEAGIILGTLTLIGGAIGHYVFHWY